MPGYLAFITTILERHPMSNTRTRLVMGNWKMHGNLAQNAKLLAGLCAAPRSASGALLAVCVPFPYLAQVAQALKGTTISWGAQDISAKHKAPLPAKWQARCCLTSGAVGPWLGILSADRFTVKRINWWLTKPKRLLQAE
jgi:hypothetical protein